MMSYYNILYKGIKFQANIEILGVKVFCVVSS